MAQSKRIGYIDALRGFVMFIVVFQHIRAFGFGLMENDGVLSKIYLTFMLPSFFLVSGFTSYRTRKYLHSTMLLSRFRQLVVPTVIFLLIHNFLGYENWGFPGGYWFTYALFIIIIINYAIQKILPDKLYVTFIIVMSMIFFVVRGMLGTRLDSGWMHYICLRAVMTFFQYYALGVILKKYYEKVVYLFSSSVIRNLIIILTVIGFLFSKQFFDLAPHLFYAIYSNILGFLATIAVFMLFYNFRIIIEGENLVARCLNYVGRRTLDLYMLHYFFIPSMLAYGYLFKSTGNCCLELGVIGLLTIMVTTISLSLSNILRVSTFINYWLFGGKKCSKTVQIESEK